MHILLIPSWYPENSHDISGSFFREQAIALANTGHRVGALCFFERRDLLIRPTLWGGLLSVEKDHGVETWRVHHVGRIGRAWRFIQPFFIGRFFERYCEENGQPDLIHAHSAIGAGGFSADLSMRYGVPYVITEHSTAFPRKLVSNGEMILAKRAFENASRIIAVSTGLANSISETCRINRPICVVPNILNETIFGDFNIVTRPKGKIFTFLNIGMLSKKKGQDYLIRAFAIEFRDRPVELLIGGYGEERSSLQKLIGSLGMERQIRLLGKLSRQEVRDQMMKCDAFVLSSLFETFGVVLIEALACGKPILATKCGGPEDVVNDANGILVDKGSVEQLALGMERIYQNIDSFDSSTIHDNCLQRFGQKAVIEQLAEIYQIALSR